MSLNDALEEMGIMDGLHGVFLSLFGQQNPCRLRIREVCSYYPYRFTLVFNLMGTQHFKGILVMVPNNLINLINCDGRHGFYCSTITKQV